MQAVVEFLVAHGHAVVFVWVLAAQAGLPVPVVPLLLAAGALAGAGSLDLWRLLLLSALASLLSDGLWFLLGRRHGSAVLAILCKLSLEPDSCVRRTQVVFSKRAWLTVLLGKFVPGINLVAPPLAGMSRMSAVRFLALDGAGCLLWSAACLLPGYAFHDRLEELAEGVSSTGAWLLGAFVAAIAAWILWRWVLRRRLLRELRIARIEPLDLHRLLQDGEAVFVVDLRHAGDFEFDPYVIPGAMRLDADAIDDRHAEIPRDRDVVLYCS